MSKKGGLLKSDWNKVCKSLLAVACAVPFMWGGKVAAEPVVKWEETYENLNGVMKHGKDGLYFAQLTGDEIKLVQMNESGKVVDHETFAKKEIGTLASFTQKKKGGYVFAGWTESKKLYLMEVDKSGVLQWEKTLEKDYSDLGYSVDLAELQDGNIVLAAETDLYDYYIQNDIYLAKLTNNGEIQWDKKIGDYDYYDKVSRVVPTQDGGFLFLGELGTAEYTELNYDNYTDMYAVKFDSSGNQEWDKQYESNRNTEPKDAIETADGGFLIAANNYTDYIVEDVDGYVDGYYMKLDKSGKLEWEANLPRALSNTRINDIQQTEDGGFILAGRADYGIDWSSYSTIKHAYLRKIDQTGQVEWENVIEKDDRAIESAAVFQTEAGGYVSVIKEESKNLWHIAKVSEQ
ncbi:hypothetical protein [Brevibacillus formosus]|uniref:hypothetical protein n=1 Tax=Brevibacillus formosus TaxID=54913 RepID=UPI003F1C284B